VILLKQEKEQEKHSSIVVANDSSKLTCRENEQEKNKRTTIL